MKRCVTSAVLVGVALSNQAKVTQVGSKLGPVQLQTAPAFHYAVQSHNPAVETDEETYK